MQESQITKEQQDWLCKERRLNRLKMCYIWFNIIVRLICLSVILLPVLMKWLCVPIFQLTFEEYITELRGDGLLVLLFTVYFVSGSAMLFAAYTLSIVNITGSVICIILTQLMFNTLVVTIVLSVMLILGFVFKFLPIILAGDDDAFEFIVNLKWVVFGLLEVVYIVAAVKVPTEFGIGLRFLFIAGAITNGLSIFTMFGDDDEELSLREVREAVEMLRIIRWRISTADGRYPGNWDPTSFDYEIMDIVERSAKQ